jgi:tRNA A37 threonylcarbamoyladenosine synthetase subunit TsaC/SUA5/YrdC
VAECWLRSVDLMLDAGDGPPGPTSMVDCTGDEPEILRQGFQPVDLQRPTRRK